MEEVVASPAIRGDVPTPPPTTGAAAQMPARGPTQCGSGKLSGLFEEYVVGKICKDKASSKDVIAMLEQDSVSPSAPLVLCPSWGPHTPAAS